MLLHLTRAAPGVHIRLNAAVRDIQPDPTLQGGLSVMLASGEVLLASRNIIIRADGVKSTLQKAVTGLDDALMPAGDAALPHNHRQMLQDPELAPVLLKPLS